VLRALVTGRSPQDIASALNLSVKTVHNLHYQVKAKLGVSSDFELARLAWQNGLTI
jgi:DNA-binding CsgD family transcriptional regulator